MEEIPTDARVVAAVLSSLSPFGTNSVPEKDHATFEVPRDWQALASSAQFLEVRGVSAGLAYGYVADLLGRAAASGEQLAMSLSAVRDAEAWLSREPKKGFEYQRPMAGRALAEASGLWTIAAGHAAMNVVARVIRAHSKAIFLDKGFGWAGPPPPFSDERPYNLSLNKNTVKVLARAAAETEEGALVALVDPLKALLQGSEWTRLEERRHVGYHRLRPQSLEGGALAMNPWKAGPDGSMSLEVGVTSGHVPPALDVVVVEARAGHDALSAAMRSVLEALPAATRSAGVALWPEA